MGGAAHVLLHELHAGGGLEVEAAGIEANALAHQSDPRPPAAPAEIDQPRRLGARPADRVDRRIVLLEQGIAGDHADPAAVGLGELAGGGGKLRRAEVASRGVDQVAHQAGRPGRALDRSALGPLGPDQLGEAPRLAVAGEGVAASAQPRAASFACRRRSAPPSAGSRR